MELLSPFDTRLQAILSKFVKPLLKESGFARTGDTYVRKQDELSWLIDVQKSRYNDGTQASFTLNCGVYVPGVLSRYGLAPEPSRPKVYHCVVSARVGMLSKEHLDIWWTLTAVEDAAFTDAKIGREVARRLVEHVLPFLQRFSSRAEVMNFLLMPRKDCEEYVEPRDRATSLIYAAILSLILGDRAQCEAIMNMAAVLAAGNPFWSDFPEVRRRVLDI